MIIITCKINLEEVKRINKVVFKHVCNCAKLCVK